MRNEDDKNRNLAPKREFARNFTPESEAELAQIIQELPLCTVRVDLSHLLTDWYDQHMQLGLGFSRLLLNNDITPADMGFFQLTPEAMLLVKARSVVNEAAKSNNRRATVLDKIQGGEFLFSVEVLS